MSSPKPSNNKVQKLSKEIRQADFPIYFAPSQQFFLIFLTFQTNNKLKQFFQLKKIACK
jgi:hypothetical protein